MRRTVLVLSFLVFLPACYHATVTTGLRPSTIKIEAKWADSWINGLVPPDAVETMEGCSAGVAQVETKLSFLNQLVGALTMGIYTPMEIVVTCADDRQDLPEATGEVDAERLIRSRIPFLVRLD